MHAHTDIRREQCRSPHGERGLKYRRGMRQRLHSCRFPHGERGLKFPIEESAVVLGESLSSRRAWIDMRTAWRAATRSCSRSPHGERGLKYVGLPVESRQGGRSPHGERGLKLESRNAGDQLLCRSPHGERGLKYAELPVPRRPWWSLSSRRVRLKHDGSGHGIA